MINSTEIILWSEKEPGDGGIPPCIHTGCFFSKEFIPLVIDLTKLEENQTHKQRIKMSDLRQCHGIGVSVYHAAYTIFITTHQKSGAPQLCLVTPDTRQYYHVLKLSPLLKFDVSIDNRNF